MKAPEDRSPESPIGLLRSGSRSKTTQSERSIRTYFRTRQSDLSYGPIFRTSQSDRSDGPTFRTSQSDRSYGPRRRTSQSERSDGYQTVIHRHSLRSHPQDPTVRPPSVSQLRAKAVPCTHKPPRAHKSLSAHSRTQLYAMSHFTRKAVL